jgi:ubiquinone/menaquinone biosynthesis C-methylase UbiE
MTTAATLQAEYDHWYDEKLAEHDRPAELAPWHHQAIPLLPDLAGKRVLDMGAGLGAFSRYVAQQGAAEVVAGDLSTTAVDYANRVVLADVPNASAVVADAMAIPFPDESFDVTMCFSTLEHVIDTKTALAELVRVTRPGGELLFVIPNYLSLTGLARLYMVLRGREVKEIGQPVNHPLKLPTFVRWVRNAGCKVTAVDGEYHVLFLPGDNNYVVLHWLEKRPLRWLTRWFGLHAVVRARKR